MKKDGERRYEAGMPWCNNRLILLQKVDIGSGTARPTF